MPDIFDQLPDAGFEDQATPKPDIFDSIDVPEAQVPAGDVFDAIPDITPQDFARTRIVDHATQFNVRGRKGVLWGMADREAKLTFPQMYQTFVPPAEQQRLNLMRADAMAKNDLAAIARADEAIYTATRGAVDAIDPLALPESEASMRQQARQMIQDEGYTRTGLESAAEGFSHNTGQLGYNAINRDLATAGREAAAEQIMREERAAARPLTSAIARTAGNILSPESVTVMAATGGMGAGVTRATGSELAGQAVAGAAGGVGMGITNAATEDRMASGEEIAQNAVGGAIGAPVAGMVSKALPFANRAAQAALAGNTGARVANTAADIVAGGVANAATNVATGAGMAAATGNEYGLEQAATDALMGAALEVPGRIAGRAISGGQHVATFRNAEDAANFLKTTPGLVMESMPDGSFAVSRGQPQPVSEPKPEPRQVEPQQVAEAPRQPDQPSEFGGYPEQQPEVSNEQAQSVPEVSAQDRGGVPAESRTVQSSARQEESAGANNSDQGGQMARGQDDAGTRAPVAESVQPVVSEDGPQTGAQPGDVGGVTEYAGGSQPMSAERAGVLAGEEAARQTVPAESASATPIASRDDTGSQQANDVPSQFRLNKPIKGKTGYEIVGYEWRHTKGEKYNNYEGGMVGSRVSDWDRAGKSELTGRDIVHLYYVKGPDGKISVQGVGAAQNILGISETRLQSIAKAEQAAQRYRAESELKRADDIAKSSQPTKGEAIRAFRNRNWSPLRTDAENAKLIDGLNVATLTKGGKFYHTVAGDAAMLERHGWTRVDAGTPPVENSQQATIRDSRTVEPIATDAAKVPAGLTTDPQVRDLVLKGLMRANGVDRSRAEAIHDGVLRPIAETLAKWSNATPELFLGRLDFQEPKANEAKELRAKWKKQNDIGGSHVWVPGSTVWVRAGDLGRSVIKYFESSDPATAVHEPLHAVRKLLAEVAQRSPDAKRVLRGFEEDIGVKDGRWLTKHEEAFVQKYLSYIKTGEAPTSRIKAFFDQVRELLRSIARVAGAKPSEKFRQAAAELLGGESKVGVTEIRRPDQKAPARERVAGPWSRDRVRENLSSAYEQATGVREQLDALREQVRDGQVGIHPDDLDAYNKAERQALREYVSEDGASERPLSPAEVDTILTHANADLRTERARAWANESGDPAAQFAAWFDQTRDGTKKELIDISGTSVDDMLGKTFTINGEPFRIQIDENDVVSLVDTDVEFPYADAIAKDGKIPVDKGSVQEEAFAPDEGLAPAPEEPKRPAGQQIGLLGERFDGPVAGSRTGNMFGDISEGPASKVEAEAPKTVEEQKIARNFKEKGGILFDTKNESIRPLFDSTESPAKVKLARDMALRMASKLVETNPNRGPVLNKIGNETPAPEVPPRVAPKRMNDILASAIAELPESQKSMAQQVARVAVLQARDIIAKSRKVGFEQAAADWIKPAEPTGRDIRDMVRESTGLAKREKIVMSVQDAIRKTMLAREYGRKQGLAEAKALRKQLVEAAAILPRDIRGELVPMLASMKNERDMWEKIEKVKNLFTEAEKRDAINEVRDLIRGTDARHMRPEYKAQLEAITGSIDLRTMKDSTARRAQGLADYLMSNPDAAEGLPTDAKNLLARLKKNPLDSFRTEELRELANTIRGIVHQNELKTTLYVAGKARKLVDDVSAIAGHGGGGIDNAPGKAGELDKYGTDLADKEATDKRAALKGNASIMQRGLDFTDSTDVIVTRIAGEGGVLHQRAYTDMVKAKDEMYATLNELDSAMEAVRKAHGMDDEKMIRWRNQGRSFRLENGRTAELTGPEMATVYGWTMNPRGYEDLIKNGFLPGRFAGRDDKRIYVSPSDLDRLAAQLTPFEKAYAEQAIKMLNGGRLNEAMRKTALHTKGYDPFIEQNYLPLRVDLSGKQQNATDILKAMRNYDGLVKEGFLNERISHGHPLIANDIHDLFYRHAAKAANFAHMNVPINNLLMVLGNPQVSQKINRMHGEALVKHLHNYALDVYGQGGADPNETWMRRMASAAGRSVLGLRISTIIKNGIGGPLDLSTQLPPELRASFFKNLANVKENYSNDVFEKEIAPYSPTLAARFKESGLMRAAFADPELMGTLSDNVAINRLRRFQEWAMMPMQRAERGGIIAAWRTLMADAQAKNPGKSVAELAPAVADKLVLAVRRSQNPHDALDVSQWGRQIKKNPALGMMFMFTSQAAKTRDAIRLDYMRYRRGEIDGKTFAANMATRSISTVVLSAAVAALMRVIREGGREEDTRKAKGMGDYAQQALGEMGDIAHPLAGDVVRRLAGGMLRIKSQDRPETIIGRGVSELGRAWDAIFQVPDSPEKAYGAAATLLRGASMFAGLPVDAPLSLAEGAAKGAIGRPPEFHLKNELYQVEKKYGLNKQGVKLKDVIRQMTPADRAKVMKLRAYNEKIQKIRKSADEGKVKKESADAYIRRQVEAAQRAGAL